MTPAKKTYYKVCEYCGAHLDPGEKCDCRKETYFLNGTERGEEWHSKALKIEQEKPRQTLTP